MSASLLDLIKAYGDARADWALGRVNRVPEALIDVEVRIDSISTAVNDIPPGVSAILTALYGTE